MDIFTIKLFRKGLEVENISKTMTNEQIFEVYLLGVQNNNNTQYHSPDLTAPVILEFKRSNENESRLMCSKIASSGYFNTCSSMYSQCFLYK